MPIALSKPRVTPLLAPLIAAALLAGCQRNSAPADAEAPAQGAAPPAAAASAAETDQFFGLYWREGSRDLFSACGQAEVYQLSADPPLLNQLRQARGQLDEGTPIFVHLQASAETSMEEIPPGSDSPDADAAPSAPEPAANGKAATAPKTTQPAKTPQDSAASDADDPDTGYSNRLQVQSLLEHSTTLPADCQDDTRALWADQAPDDDAPPDDAKAARKP
ncbi:hypothetical protein [Amphibiibacter pelophylacis]|uniref:Uncharacterized protein n=1 Tax=Amphibiibacter pelophylacis TaxID=1799477 RepID=A0ACC6P263_9BURK